MMQLKLIPAILAVCLTSISVPLLAAQGRSVTSADLAAEEVADLNYIQRRKSCPDSHPAFRPMGTTVFNIVSPIRQDALGPRLGSN
jgi:hypothetical protein